MASLWIRSGLGWPERDFEVVIQTYQVGAHFEALDELVFMAPSDLRCIFLSSEPFRLSYVNSIQLGHNFAKINCFIGSKPQFSMKF